MSLQKLKETLPESGEASRYVDKSTGNVTSKVMPGFFYVTKNPEMIMTVLGSCIAACIRDPIAGIGGMNHFMLPVGTNDRADSWGTGASAANRFGNYAMENLINSLIKYGAVKSRLEIKLFGGGRVLDISADVGAKNIDFVRKYLKDENLNISASDMGDDCARKIIYDPLTGLIKLKRLRDIYSGYVVKQEKELMSGMKDKPVSGTVELFD